MPAQPAYRTSRSISRLGRTAEAARFRDDSHDHRRSVQPESAGRLPCALPEGRRCSETRLKILVTGGAGFIGSALVRQLIAESTACVVNVDKLTYAGNL